VNAGRFAILTTLVVAFGLGLYSFAAMKRNAARRVSLVDEMAAQMPAMAGARVLSPWEPATYADDVRALYCLDEADAEAGAGRVLNAFLAAGWTKTELRREAAAGAVVLSLAGPLRLRVGVAPGTRRDCDGGKHQVTVAFDGTR
jgi:hypothetical protein